MSLLAKFYNQIKISHEDIVSESLTYILEKSAVAKEVIATQMAVLSLHCIITLKLLKRIWDVLTFQALIVKEKKKLY